MAETPDWRSARYAEKLLGLDREAFAVEFLRRNAAYVADYNSTQASIEAGGIAAEEGARQSCTKMGLELSLTHLNGRCGSRRRSGGRRCRRQLSLSYRRPQNFTVLGQ